MGAKHAFLRAGLGCGFMPLPIVAEDLASGKLVRIALEPHTTSGGDFSMHALHMKDASPGPAGRWFVERPKKA